MSNTQNKSLEVPKDKVFFRKKVKIYTTSNTVWSRLSHARNTKKLLNIQNIATKLPKAWKRHTCIFSFHVIFIKMECKYNFNDRDTRIIIEN